MPTTAAHTRATKRVPHNIDAAMKAGEAKPRSRAADPSAAYVRALVNAEGFHKKAFFVEMAVCLVFYADAEDSSAKTKKLLRPIYQRAGYDCESPRGDDYKTVQRRISVAADLFVYLGATETIADWTADVKNGIDSINEVAVRLEKQKLDSIEAVRKLVNRTPAPRAKPANAVIPAQAAVASKEGGDKDGHPQGGLPQTEASSSPDEADKALAAQLEQNIAARQAEGPAPVAPGSRRLEDTLPPERVLKTPHLVLAIPLETSREELMAMAQLTLAFAATMQEQTAVQATA